MNPKEGKLSITVKTLFLENKKPLKLELVSGKSGLKKTITKKELHRPGLALAGFVDKFTYKRVQICGNTEILYLKKLTPAKRQKAVQKVMAFDIPCFIVTDSNEIPAEFALSSEQHGIPVFRTPFATTQIAQHLGDYLDGKFALRTFIHGSLVDVYGIGVLIAGRSGIGKSEVALDLVARGHRLVVDDVVTIVQRSGGILIGLGNDKLKYHMEIRGLGVVDVQAMFGIRGIRRQKRVEVQLELVDWDNSEKYERLGLKEITTDILGVTIPLVRLPVYPGKNISVIAETIAMNQLLKIYGLDSAREFEKELYRKQIKETLGAKEYLGRDFE